ncbi:MAG: cytochrome c3 family protein [Candidatus Promineifilaceae bacterium]
MKQFNRACRFALGTGGIWVLFLVLGGLLAFSSTQTYAAADSPDQVILGTSAENRAASLLLLSFQGPGTNSHPATDFACTSCHSDTTAVIEFPSGETMSVQVDLTVLALSAHGNQSESPLACTDCHQTINDYQFPHTPLDSADLRAYQVAQAATCERCHQQTHITSHPGDDAAMPVTCTDCHGSHDVHTAEAWDSAEAVDRCVNCHVKEEVELNQADQLLPLIRSGLFTDEPNSDYCLACHSQPDRVKTFPNGDMVSLTIDKDAFHASVHGLNNSWQPLECNDCHQNHIFPHQPTETESARDFTIAMNSACQDCHVQFFDKAMDSVHGAALQDGNTDAAVCTDCHGAHDTPVPGVPRSAISHTCEKCHSTIFNEYAESVHGSALLEEDNPDVPTCVDCHGVHDIHDPTTAQARERSPELCAKCHADYELMTKYEISTNVFDSYVSDFHGTTVMLFQNEGSDVPPNTAVCYDCHGVHNIKSPSDPDAGIQQNLIETCRQCHPDAQPNFAGAWLSHYTPSLQNYPVIFLVDLFYKIVIPLTLGFFSLMVGTDIYRRVRMRLRKNKA